MKKLILLCLIIVNIISYNYSFQLEGVGCITFLTNVTNVVHVKLNLDISKKIIVINNSQKFSVADKVIFLIDSTLSYLDIFALNINQAICNFSYLDEKYNYEWFGWMA
jgi:hypothetical protein